MRKKKRIFAVLLSMVLMLLSTGNVFAAEATPSEDIQYFVINDEIVVPEGQDYENPETGEYFRWKTSVNARGAIVKEFEFMVRYSVTSSSFTVGSTKVEVESSAYVGYSDYDPAVGNYNGHVYRVEIIGWLTRSLTFEVGGDETGVVTGLQNGGSYKVRIANEDYLESPLYLIGGGTVRNK